jgi:hypothetical protein
MTEEFKQWEYRVQTIGSMFDTKDEHIEEPLDAWGEEGWEAINVYTPSGSFLCCGSQATVQCSRRELVLGIR